MVFYQKKIFKFFQTKLVMVVDTNQTVKKEVIKILNKVQENFGVTYNENDVNNIKDFYHDLKLDSFMFVSLLNSFFNSGETNLKFLSLDHLTLLENIDENWSKNPKIKYNLFEEFTKLVYS